MFLSLSLLHCSLDSFLSFTTLSISFSAQFKITITNKQLVDEAEYKRIV